MYRVRSENDAYKERVYKRRDWCWITVYLFSTDSVEPELVLGTVKPFKDVFCDSTGFVFGDRVSLLTNSL